MECTGIVKEISKSQIPFTNIMRIECDDGRKIEMLIHDELLNFKLNEKVKVVISEELPEFKDGVDLCGRGMFYKDEGERKLFSIGGFLVVVWHAKEKFKLSQKYYICVLHMSDGQ